MGDEGLEDVTTNRVFFHVSKIGAVCAEVNVLIVIVLGQAVTGVYGSQISIEELLKKTSTEAASKSGAVWSKDGVRLCITDETKNQVGGGVYGITVRRARRSLRGNRIKDQVRGDLGMGLCNPKPEAKKCERLFVVLCG